MRSTRSVLLLLLLLVGCARPSVLVVGLDGADWDVMDPLMQAGFLPTLRDLVEGGARGEYDCAPAMPVIACFCPPVWTSLFTGHMAVRHGTVRDFTPASERRVKAVWSVLREYGGTSTAVALHNNIPPDPDFDEVLAKAGIDHAASQRFVRWPPGLPLAAFVPALRAKPVGRLEALGLLPHAGERPPVWAPIARDRVSMEALRRSLLDRGPSDLTLVLLHSTDKVAHLVWDSVQPGAGEPLDAAALLEAAARWDGPHEAAGPFGWGPVVAPYLEIDQWLGGLLADVAFDYVVLVSDHGMTRSEVPGLPGRHGPTFPDAHRGILAFHGPDVRPGSDFGLVHVADFAPTLAHLLDLPIADDLPGRILDEIFLPERYAWRRVLRVGSWEHTTLFELILEVLRQYPDEAAYWADTVFDGDA